MYRRKKRLFRRKKRLYRRRIPRMMTSNVLYTKLTQLRSLTGSLGSQAYVDLGFNLPDLVNYNGISPFWDRVRVHKVVVNIRPKFNVIGWTINDSTGAVPEIGDHGIVRTPSTYFPTTPTFNFQAFSSLDKVKIVRGCQNLRAVCIPNIIQQGTAFQLQELQHPLYHLLFINLGFQPQRLMFISLHGNGHGKQGLILMVWNIIVMLKLMLNLEIDCHQDLMLKLYHLFQIKDQNVYIHCLIT